MKGTISVDSQRCKACCYCIEACPKDLIEQGVVLNKQGLAFVVFVNGNYDCTGCGLCFVVCPEVVIEVFKTTADEGGRND